MRPLKLSQKLFCIGFSWRNEMPGDPVVLRPSEHGVRGELGPIVRDDHPRACAAPLYQCRQFPAPRVRPEIEVVGGSPPGTFPRHTVIDNVQDAEIVGPQASWSWDKIQRTSGRWAGRLDQDSAPASLLARRADPVACAPSSPLRDRAGRMRLIPDGSPSWRNRMNRRR